MTTLKTLLDQHQQARGITRLVIQQQIRYYVQTCSLPALLEEIERVDDEKDLDVLIGAGMRGVLYYKCLEQKARMAGI